MRPQWNEIKKVTVRNDNSVMHECLHQVKLRFSNKNSRQTLL